MLDIAREQIFIGLGEQVPSLIVLLVCIYVIELRRDLERKIRKEISNGLIILFAATLLSGIILGTRPFLLDVFRGKADWIELGLLISGSLGRSIGYLVIGLTVLKRHYKLQTHKSL
jgi:hypothetical protein